MFLKYDFLADERAQMALNIICQRQLDSKTSYRLAKIKSACDKEGKSFYPKYIDLIKKYAFLNEDGSLDRRSGENSFTIKPENKEAWEKESAELLAKEFEVTNIEKLYLESLGTAIEPAVLQALLPILEDELE